MIFFSGHDLFGYKLVKIIVKIFLAYSLYGQYLGG